MHGPSPKRPIAVGETKRGSQARAATRILGVGTVCLALLGCIYIDNEPMDLALGGVQGAVTNAGDWTQLLLQSRSRLGRWPADEDEILTVISSQPDSQAYLEDLQSLTVEHQDDGGLLLTVHYSGPRRADSTISIRMPEAGLLDDVLP